VTRLSAWRLGGAALRANAKGTSSEALALQALALDLAGAADGLGGLARAALGGLLVVAAKLHLGSFFLRALRA